MTGIKYLCPNTERGGGGGGRSRDCGALRQQLPAACPRRDSGWRRASWEGVFVVEGAPWGVYFFALFAGAVGLPAVVFVYSRI